MNVRETSPTLSFDLFPSRHAANGRLYIFIKNTQSGDNNGPTNEAGIEHQIVIRTTQIVANCLRNFSRMRWKIVLRNYYYADDRSKNRIKKLTFFDDFGLYNEIGHVNELFSSGILTIFWYTDT